MPKIAPNDGLNAFQHALQGHWTNAALPGAHDDAGSKDNPLSYNVMPLPQESSPTGYILKNTTIWENIRFNDDGKGVIAVPTVAANRGTGHSQAPTALYYEQQVFFSQGPSKDQMVHSENGSWLNLQTIDPIVGPYGTPLEAPTVFQDPNEQPPTLTLAKQMSVPHGNSVLAVGSFTGAIVGAPTIPDSAPTTPSPPGLDVTAYTTATPPKSSPDDFSNYQNPLPEYSVNPVKPLQQAVEILDVQKYMSWTVTTKQIAGGHGSVANIPFEERAARVADYTATYWLMSVAGDSYDYLAYTQWIDLQIPIAVDGLKTTYTFPHVTSNVISRQQVGS